MGVSDLFKQVNMLDAWAKYQMTLGGLLVLFGIAIVVFPAILVALVASAIILAGVSLIAAGWRRGRAVQRLDGLHGGENDEW
jgi:urea transporter